MKILFWRIEKDKISWCKFWHTAVQAKNPKKWYCPKCNITYDKKLSDADNCGPL